MRHREFRTVEAERAAHDEWTYEGDRKAQAE